MRSLANKITKPQFLIAPKIQHSSFICGISSRVNYSSIILDSAIKNGLLRWYISYYSDFHIAKKMLAKFPKIKSMLSTCLIIYLILSAILFVYISAASDWFNLKDTNLPVEFKMANAFADQILRRKTYCHEQNDLVPFFFR